VIDKVRLYIETHRLLNHDKPVITGISGGSDSVSLLYILNCLGYNCIAAHCNFHLRGDEANRDADFARQAAINQGNLFEQTDFNTEEYARERHISAEMAAREMRYQWFEQLRIKHDAQAIAVAHHRDDNAETLLLNLVRGAGIRGLCGMKPRNGFIVRPFLCLDKDEIMRFVADKNIAFVNDSTNSSTDYKRNFIRIKALPLLKDLNPSVTGTLSDTAERLADVEAIYSQAVAAIAEGIVQKADNERIELSISKLLQTVAPKTVLYEMLKPYGFTGAVTEEIFSSLTGISGKKFYSSTSYEALKDRDTLLVYQAEPLCEDKTYIIENEVFDCSALPVRLAVSKVAIAEGFKPPATPDVATFDYDKLRFPLTMRRWRHGDRFVPFGMKGSKKLSDLFTDCKLSLADKQHLFLLCSGDDIIWVTGIRSDNRYRIGNDSKTALIFRLLKDNK